VSGSKRASRRLELFGDSTPPEDGNTGYTQPMAKVMISLPDDVLARIDAQATEHGTTRSATIRELAEAGLGERQQRLSERMAALEGHATAHGGHAVDELKADRPR
jgi:plasmid stability protein